MKWMSALLGVACCLALQIARAQVIDSVIVEVYHVQPMPQGPPLVTWRIHIDLAEGHELQMVYGDRNNPLEIATTSTFFNDTVNGVAYAHRIPAHKLDRYPLALDSWLTIGAASDRHWGLPRNADADGSILGCPPYPDRDALAPLRSAGPTPLCVTDGLQARDTVRDVVDFRMATGYLDRYTGSVLHTMDGAWAVLGGTPGITGDNVVLIAQLSTTGTLTYRLNLQVRTPQRKVVRCVSTATGSTEEILVPALSGKASWAP